MSKKRKTLDDKIEDFIEEVNKWQIAPAKEMLEKGTIDWDFGILKVVMSYFEMIAKYRDGNAEDRKSGEFFKKGLKQVFPEIENWSVHEKTVVLDWFYRKVRCGLYHAGMTGSAIGIWLDRAFGLSPFQLESHETTYDNGRLERTYQININVVLFVAALENDFKKYVSELRDQNNVTARENFQKKFDFDHEPPPVEVLRIGS